jgi:serine/threonine-protein kinase SRPK3
MKRRMGAHYEHKPEYFYGPIERGRVKADLLLQEITLIDMGEAVLLDVAAEPKNFGYNLCYAAPEFHFGGQRSKASDIWALACGVFEIRSGRQLFAECFSGLFGMMIRMTETIGPLPRDWLEQKITTAPNIIERIDERARTVAKGQGDHSLKARVEAIGKWNSWCHWSPEERLEKLVESERYYTRKSTEEELQREINRGPNPHGPLSREEVSDFTNLLSKMLKYDPEERITIEEVLEHPWLNRSYEDVLEWTGPWMQECDTGRADWNEDELA